jgi:hypothetical protein
VAPKVALDFLLRQATITSRSIPIQSLPQDGENSLGGGNTSAGREGADMAVWIMPRLQHLRCADFMLSRAELATGAGETLEMIQDNVLRTRRRSHALNHGGAIV